MFIGVSFIIHLKVFESMSCSEGEPVTVNTHRFHTFSSNRGGMAMKNFDFGMAYFVIGTDWLCINGQKIWAQSR